MQTPGHPQSKNHPQADGLVERLNKTLIDMLAKHVQQNQREWDRWLSRMLFSYGTATQASTGRSPFHLVYGRDPRIRLDVHVDTPLPDPHTVVQYAQTVKQEHRRLQMLRPDKPRHMTREFGKAIMLQVIWYIYINCTVHTLDLFVS